MTRKDRIKKLDKKVAEINKELKELRQEDRNCHDSPCKDNCMHGATFEESHICYNTECRHYAGDCADHFFRCNKCINDSMGKSSMAKKVNACCGFTRKGLTCKCNMRCC
jgi:hypothetical protein